MFSVGLAPRPALWHMGQTFSGTSPAPPTRRDDHARAATTTRLSGNRTGCCAAPRGSLSRPAVAQPVPPQTSGAGARCMSPSCASQRIAHAAPERRSSSCCNLPSSRRRVALLTALGALCRARLRLASSDMLSSGCGCLVRRRRIQAQYRAICIG